VTDTAIRLLIILFYIGVKSFRLSNSERSLFTPTIGTTYISTEDFRILREKNRYKSKKHFRLKHRYTLNIKCRFTDVGLLATPSKYVSLSTT
jgi:hypothetical protein